MTLPAQQNEELISRAQALHHASIVVDALDVSLMNREHFEHMRDGGVTAANVTVTLEHNFHATIDLLSDFQRVFAANVDLIRPVRSAADIRVAKAEGRVGIIHGTQNATPLEGDLRLLPLLHFFGIRIVQLAYMTGNLLGDGCLEPRNAGLTIFGRKAIGAMNAQGILIDLSHCGDRTSLETIEESGLPVAFTHACARSICKHPRNKTDEAMKALAAKGGVMGITSLAAFVAEDWREADLMTYLDQMEYAIQLMGIDHVGIGMDFVEFLPASFLVPARWGGVHVPSGLEGLTEWPIPYARGIDNSTKLTNITAGLLTRGYAEADVRKVLGENFLRLFEQVWATSEQP